MLKPYLRKVEEEQEKTKAKAKGVSKESKWEPIRSPESPIPSHGALRAPFIGEAKLAGEALRPARGASGNRADSPAGVRRVVGHRRCTSAGTADVP